LVQHRAARPGARHAPRRRHGAPADRWARGQPSSGASAAGPPPHLHPRQQHQPGARRRLARARQRARRRLGGRLRRPGDRAVTDPGAKTPGELVAELRDEGARRYHDRHPFHLRMHDGSLSAAELRCWVRNRYYYQTRIPIKDALILAKSEDAAFRRRWRRRLCEQDGDGDDVGGLELWLRLGEAVGLERRELRDHRNVLPGVRFACDAYVESVARFSLVEAVAASLTECFAPDLMSARIQAWERHYPWVDAG